VYTALSCDVIHYIFVLFAFAYLKVEVIWFDTLVSDQTVGLRLKFETLVSAKDKVTH